MEPGIYALCEVESAAFDGTGASDDFWAPGAKRAPGWPTVKLRYLRSFLGNPLTIERLRAERPKISKLVLDGFQASSFPISAEDFRAIIELFGVDLSNLDPSNNPPSVSDDDIGAIEKKYLHASPEVKDRTSRYIERGTVGAEVKKRNGYKCQICEALGRNPYSFKKTNGEPYVEAHHVMPVSELQIGSLAASNIMTLCANHHRQVHYGGIAVTIRPTTFELTIDEVHIGTPRLGVGQSSSRR